MPADPWLPLPRELDPRPGRARHRAAGQGPGSGRRWAVRGARLVAALASLAMFLTAAYAWATFRHFTSSVTRVDAIAPRAPHQSDRDGSAQNILLIGDDHRMANLTPVQMHELNAAPDGGGLNTDTMLVLHIPADGSRATGISFPRDSWVNIPGFGMNKLNAAFNFGTENGGGDAGGARLLIRVIQTMTGLTIDHFVRVSMLGFYNIAAALGPIRVCLNERAVDSYSGTDLPAGVSYLNPSQSLSFVRQRHNLPRGDLDREVRQQYFLSAALRKVISAGTLLNPIKLRNLLDAVGSALETDTGLDLLKFAEQFQNLSAGNVRFATIPITGTPTITVGGTDVSIVSVDSAALPGFISSIVGPPPAYAAAHTLARSSVTVTVLNASGTNGAASQDSTALDQLGFHTATPGSASATSLTTIEYPPGMEAQAKTLAAVVPGATITPTSTADGVTLVLGGDGIHVAAVTHAAPTQTSTSQLPSTASSTASSPARAYGSTDCIN